MCAGVTGSVRRPTARQIGVASNGPLPPARDSSPNTYGVDLVGGDTLTYGRIHTPNPDDEPMAVLSVDPNVANLEVIDVVAVLAPAREEHGINHGGWGWWPATR